MFRTEHAIEAGLVRENGVVGDVQPQQSRPLLAVRKVYDLDARIAFAARINAFLSASAPMLMRK